MRGTALRHFLPQQIHITKNGREHVVEVVCHAAREPTDGFHFLSLPQLRFQAMAFGDIAVVEHDGSHRRVVQPVGDRPFALVPGVVPVTKARVYQ